MGHQIIKQPNGLYAMWSSIVDDFVMIDCTPEDIIDELAGREKERIVDRVSQVLSALEEGKKPYYQFTKTFDEAVRLIKEIHGNDAESLVMLGMAGKKEETALLG